MVCYKMPGEPRRLKMNKFERKCFPGLLAARALLTVCITALMLPTILNGFKPVDPAVRATEVTTRITAMRTEIAAKSYTFTVGWNPALQYDPEELCSFRTEDVLPVTQR